MAGILIATSLVNPASSTIRESLKRLYPFKPSGSLFEGHPVLQYGAGSQLFHIISSPHDVLALDYLREHFQPDLYVVASTHRSSTNIPALTVHATGNFGNEARLGGEPSQVCKTSARFISNAFGFMQRNAPEGYEVTLEVTHHGPSRMNAPLCFIEIGSTEKEWIDARAGDVIAKTIIEAAQASEDKPVAFCVGGPHYCPNFMKPAVLEKYAVGHIASKNVLDAITKEVFVEAINATTPAASVVLLDWKGMSGEQKKKVMQIVEELNIKIEKV